MAGEDIGKEALGPESGYHSLEVANANGNTVYEMQ